MARIVKAEETGKSVRFQGYSISDEMLQGHVGRGDMIEIEEPNEWIESTHVIELPWR
jgi:hypothetical protein